MSSDWTASKGGVGRLAGDEMAPARLDALFAAAPIGLAFCDAGLRFERVNDTLAAINGRPEAEHLGRTPGELFGEPGRRIEALMREVVESGRPKIEHPLSTSGHEDHTGDERHWEASYFPVTQGGETLGVGIVLRDVTEHRRGEEQRTGLLRDTLTARAVAEAAQLRAEAAQATAELAQAESETNRRRTEFLAEVGRRMAASMDYETTLREVAAAAVPVVADWCGITMVGPGGSLDLLAAAHADPAREQMVWDLAERYPTDPEAAGGVAEVIRTGEMSIVPEVTDEMLVLAAHDDEHLRMLRTLQLHSSLVMPMKTPERTLGALTLMFAESGRTFGEDDVNLARALAGRATLHVLNARLYTDRSHTARTLQRSLLPATLPAIPGVDVAARYRPFGEHLAGGDFFDVFPTGEGTWTALIGDVAGKGPEAAAVTSLARHTLRAGAFQGLGPAANLALLNRALLEGADPTRFCTAIYARICPGDEQVVITLANGGHLPPLIQRADGRLSSVDATGTLVGGLAEAQFGEQDVHLGSGDLLLLFTDGVTETRSGGLDRGEQRLAEVLQANAGRAAEAVVRAVEEAAVELHDGSPRDDIALLALRAR